MDKKEEIMKTFKEGKYDIFDPQSLLECLSNMYDIYSTYNKYPVFEDGYNDEGYIEVL